jgi:hypothetical protein
LGREAQIAEHLLDEALGIFMVKTPYQGHPFVPVYIARPDFLGSVVAGSPNAELDAGREVMQVVDAVIDAVVLRVGTGRAFWRGLEPPMLDGIVIAGLRVPFQVVTEVMYFDILLRNSIRIGWQVGLQVVLVNTELRLQVSHRDTSEMDL